MTVTTWCRRSCSPGWGWGNFELLFNMTADSTFAYAFGRVLAWTMIWAVLATFTCYFGGILLAMFINNKNTRGKKFWRTCFMVAIAVPQFVSLLLVRNFFADAGIVNTLCKNAGLTDWLYSIGAIPTANYIPFLTHPAWARPMIILINIWVGVPYQMLIATGILMNIPMSCWRAPASTAPTPGSPSSPSPCPTSCSSPAPAW